MISSFSIPYSSRLNSSGINPNVCMLHHDCFLTFFQFTKIKNLIKTVSGFPATPEKGFSETVDFVTNKRIMYIEQHYNLTQ